MKKALLETYDATPVPKVVIAAGICALTGGPFHGRGYGDAHAIMLFLTS